MDFTFNSYEKLINLLKKNGYNIACYDDYKKYSKCAILRHDVDYDLAKALKMAEFENKLEIKSTYFLLLTSDFYNVFSKSSFQIIKKISEYGHEIGLHFDEVRYKIEPEQWKNGDIEKLIMNEVSILEGAIGIKIKSVSMHRPSKNTLESNIKLKDVVNSYSDEFFKEFKYLSDSRMRWRENVEKVISSNKYKRLHILTHAFWYFDEEKDIKTIIEEFVDIARAERYDVLDDNITDLKNILSHRYVE